MVNEKHFEKQKLTLNYFVMMKYFTDRILVSVLKSYGFYSSNQFYYVVTVVLLNYWFVDVMKLYIMG